MALAEATFGAHVGARVDVPLGPATLFSETQARAVVSCAQRQIERLLELAAAAGVPAREIGETGGDRLEIGFDGGRIATGIVALHTAWSTALPRALGL